MTLAIKEIINGVILHRLLYCKYIMFLIQVCIKILNLLPYGWNHTDKEN